MIHTPEERPDLEIHFSLSKFINFRQKYKTSLGRDSADSLYDPKEVRFIGPLCYLTNFTWKVITCSKTFINVAKVNFNLAKINSCRSKFPKNTCRYHQNIHNLQKWASYVVWGLSNVMFTPGLPNRNPLSCK